jgi:hypothetical protein
MQINMNLAVALDMNPAVALNMSPAVAPDMAQPIALAIVIALVKDVAITKTS